jgi:hypothetical protein
MCKGILTMNYGNKNNRKQIKIFHITLQAQIKPVASFSNFMAIEYPIIYFDP